MNGTTLRPLSLTIAALCALLAACAQPNGASSSKDAVIHLDDAGPPVEVVNGQPVPERLLDALAKRNNWDLSKPNIRERALRELTTFVVAAQAARDNGFMKDADFAANAELARLQGVSSATVAEFQKRADVDDSVLRSEYQKQVDKAGKVEYDFGHIVFANEADAVKAAGEVLAGKKFEKVLEEHKKDARQARTFKHIRSAQLPEPLQKALAAMKPGETAKVPVETRFGWHVLHLDAVTPFTPPAFETVKDNLRRSLTRRAGEERLTKLREEAKVTLVNPPAASSAPAAPGQAKPGADTPAGAATPANAAPASNGAKAEAAPAEPKKG